MKNTQDYPEANEIIEKALTLSEEARMYIVDLIQQSTEGCSLGEPDPEIEAAWVKLAKQRLEEIRSGRVKPIDGEVFRAKLRKRICQ